MNITLKDGSKVNVSKPSFVLRSFFNVCVSALSFNNFAAIFDKIFRCWSALYKQFNRNIEDVFFKSVVFLQFFDKLSFFRFV